MTSNYEGELEQDPGSGEQLGFGLQSITDIAGLKTELPATGIIVVVGPNNSGKSTFLREIYGGITGEGVYDSRGSSQRRWLADASVEVSGSQAAIEAWFNDRAGRVTSEPHYAGMLSLRPEDAMNTPNWNLEAVQRAFELTRREPTLSHLGPLRRFVARYIGAAERLNLSNEAPIRDTRQSPSHALHFLVDDADLEKRVSDRMFRAFGFRVCINRLDPAGTSLRIGNIEFGAASLPASRDLLEAFDDLPNVNDEGDGVRSFASLLLDVMTGDRFLTFIDEPEAFLHPPQARQLGTVLAQDGPSRGQIFLATHSRDLVQGVLEGVGRGARDVAILRLDHTAQGARTMHLLSPARVKELWSDPLMNYSRIVDGLFHRGVVVTEDDSDARFYEAHVDAATRHLAPHDFLFIGVGGKGALPRAVEILRDLRIKAVAVGDIDVLDNPELVDKLCLAAGVGLTDAERSCLDRLNQKIDDQRSAPTVRQLRALLASLAEERAEAPIDDATKAELSRLSRAQGGWQGVKRGGVNSLQGPLFDDVTFLLQVLAPRGILLVREGKLERFYPELDRGSGRSYVNRVLANRRHEETGTTAADFALRIHETVANSDNLVMRREGTVT
ncbi:AAA family ATPase [Jannaschia sp. R86511]|uniref:AAA family ATPase n=1 Tax=Jannaschia sp. R86511 TaxID=3093853 RepID=UPI0036D3EBE4